MELEAAIFDKDGVLVLTEGTYHQANKQAIKNFGGNDEEYSWEYHKSQMGMQSSERFLVIKKDFELRVRRNTYLNWYRERYRKIFEEDGLVVPDGVRELLADLKSNKIKLAVATGATVATTTWQLEKIGLAGQFDAIVTAEQVSRGKPHPDVFLKAAESLQVERERCAVFEDAMNGVIAAKAAGMKVVAVVDQDYQRDPKLAVPDLEVNSLKQVSVPLLKGLFDKQ